MRIYARSLYGLAVDTRRAAILAASLVTDGIATALFGEPCKYGCGSRFHTAVGQANHEHLNHGGNR